MLKGAIGLVCAVIWFAIAKLSFERKHKIYGATASLMGIILLANAISDGIVYKLWELIASVLVQILNIIVFLVIGEVHMPMFMVYIILIVGCFIGMVLIAICEAARKKEKQSGTVDGVKLAQKMRNRNR